MFFKKPQILFSFDTESLVYKGWINLAVRMKAERSVAHANKPLVQALQNCLRENRACSLTVWQWWQNYESSRCSEMEPISDTAHFERLLSFCKLVCFHEEVIFAPLSLFPLLPCVFSGANTSHCLLWE